jgi:AraC-like DNA-binding protein/mannose-6-phosphate isomerase-like protein (cupin superfamily)
MLMNSPEYSKRGYLNDDFRLFHIRDNSPGEMEFHYHEFDKIVIFISGSASYIVEGRRYLLEPWDILFVSHHLIHKPEIDPSVPYDRIIIYVSPEFMAAHSSGAERLDLCFSVARDRDFCLMRMGLEQQELRALLTALEGSVGSDGYGSGVMSTALFLQLLVFLDRAMLSDATHQQTGSSLSDPKIGQVLTYINENLPADLSVGRLSDMVYMSKYHFMRRFRELTGTTVHSYVTQKRLLAASELIRTGTAPSEAAQRCGFGDYSAFHRAFKTQFGVTPRDFK